MRRIDVQRHDDGIDQWCLARGPVDARLSGLVRGYNAYSERTPSFTTRRELPHAEAVLIINLGRPTVVTAGDGSSLSLGSGDGFVAGVHLRPAFSHSAGEQAGVHVELPLATLRRLTGVPMDRLTDRVVALEAICGPSARTLGSELRGTDDIEQRFRLLDEWLFAALAANNPVSEQASRAAELLRFRPDLDISDIALEVGWSRKHLAHRIHDLLGVGPRTFRRLLRFSCAVYAAGGTGKPNWADIAAHSGYADQAHFAREFRQFSGLTPTAYRSRLLDDGGGLIEC